MDMEVVRRSDSVEVPVDPELIPAVDEKQAEYGEGELVVEADAADAEKLSIAMQRCYIVVRDLMNYSLSAMFVNPVNPAVVSSYYNFVAKPLSLREVRRFLIGGGYKDSIYQFYMDIRFLLENAMSFNPEGSTIKANAQKVLIVFERMFHETVLTWDAPLPFNDCCIVCRSLFHPSGCKVSKSSFLSPLSSVASLHHSLFTSMKY
jgi:hypothetical protein